MANLRMQEESFAPRDYHKPQLDIADTLASMQMTIALRIHTSILDRVLDYCPYECFSPDGDEHYIVEFPFIENDYYYDMLLGFGAACECLEPPHVRVKIRQRIGEMAAVYEN